MAEYVFLFMVSGIEPIVTKHFNMFFWDMNNQAFYKVRSRKALRDIFIIFMSDIVESHIFTVIFINAGSGNNRTYKVSADVFNGDIRSTEVWFAPT